MFNLDQVTSVYSGRKGCACGCRGKYSYATKHVDKRPSYYCDGDGLNDRSVKSVVNKVDKLLRDPNADVKVMFDADFVAVDLGGSDRTYTVYFN